MTDKKKQTLLEISDDLIAFDELLSEKDIDDPEVQEVLAKWASEIKNNMEEKVDNYAAYVQVLMARAQIRKEESNRLAERAKVDTNSAIRLKKHLMGVLEFHKVKKMETARFQVTVANNGGKQPLEINIDPQNLPEELQMRLVKVDADKEAIRAKLDAGESVFGCCLSPRGKSLRIK